MRSTLSAPSPEARVGRWTPRGAGDAKQPRKRRESARRARAGARETVMPVPERQSLLVTRVNPGGGVKWMLWRFHDPPDDSPYDEVCYVSTHRRK